MRWHLQRAEMTMVRWMSGIKVKDWVPIVVKRETRIRWQFQYYSKTGCDGMGMCCKKKTMIGWVYGVWSGGWTYHHNLFCCSTKLMSYNPSLSLNPLLGTLSSYSLTPCIHLTILISALWSATSFSFLTGQVSLPCNILLCTQLRYHLPLTINGGLYRCAK